MHPEQRTSRRSIATYNNSGSDSTEAFKLSHCHTGQSEYFENGEFESRILTQNDGHQRRFFCQLCGKGYHSRQGLAHHKKRHEGKLYFCPICDRNMTQKGVLKRHLRTVHKSDQCARCMQIFHLEDFEQHVETCHHAYIASQKEDTF